jgi:hypothetical protein
LSPDPALVEDLRAAVGDLTTAEFAAITTTIAPHELLEVVTDVRERLELALLLRGVDPCPTNGGAGA